MAQYPRRVFEVPNSSRVTKLEFQATQEIKGLKLGDMWVTFKNKGSVYVYHNVLEIKFDAITKAESVGKALQDIINNKNIKYERVQ